MTLQAVPEIVPILKIDPNSQLALSGTPLAVKLNFAIPDGTTPGIYDGTLHVTNGSRTIPDTLKITITVVPVVTAEQTLLQLAEELRAGDIPAVLARFSASEKNYEGITKLTKEKQETLAEAILKAKLQDDSHPGARIFVMPLDLGQGKFIDTELLMAENDQKKWVIISW